MYTSARNPFLGTVTRIKPGPINADVSLELPGVPMCGIFKARQIILAA